MSESYVDPLDASIQYSRKETVVLGIKDAKCRRLAVCSLSRHNTVFDAYRDPLRLLPIFLSVPCFIRILDVQVYRMLEDEIIFQYSNSEDDTLPPLLVYGDCRLFSHPKVINAFEATPEICKRIYERSRRRARRLANKEPA